MIFKLNKQHLQFLVRRRRGKNSEQIVKRILFSKTVIPIFTQTFTTKLSLILTDFNLLVVPNRPKNNLHTFESSVISVCEN